MTDAGSVVDGIDLSRLSVGDILELPGAGACSLVAEGWAIADRRRIHHRLAHGARLRGSAFLM